ncbi:MAG: 4-hydroxy-3-methylbut-2-enyl diphosphate reductase [Armatimonadetes bacterium]|nr:4-hydroxy-3-methylbut-2-enyl diphosphate reductase [Armatimonadota bacterium]
MEIILAEHAGFCFGVRRAIHRAVEETRQRGRLYSQGPLIHNRQVVDGLRDEGLEPVESIEDVPPGAAVMLRTHGVGPTVYRRAEERGLEVIDATCPFVARAQKEASRLDQAGYRVLVLGEPDHPEAQAIREHTGGRAHIVQSPGDVNPSALTKRVAIVCQTTQRIEALQELASAVLPHVQELVVANTICDATAHRQDAARAMAQQVDVVVVIGGRHSANTTRLAQICADSGKPTYHVETADEIQCAWFEGAGRIGITAGASTPDQAIEDAVRRIQQCAPEC